MKIKIAIATGTRAEYGLLKKLIRLIDKSNLFDLQLLVTGSHLSEKYGLTYKEIEKDGIKIQKKIDIDISGDNSLNISKSTALGINGFARAFQELLPDLLIVLGDRFEILSAVIPAVFQKIPIAHIHGGELTAAAIDDSIRHSITKFSNIHFVAAESYRKRVIQLGESEERVFNVGGLGIDAISSTKFLSKKELEKSLKIKFLSKSFLVTFHPVTLGKKSSKEFVNQLIESLKKLNDTTLIITFPNFDADNLSIISEWEIFSKNRKNVYLCQSLGQLNYFSLLNYIDGVIGNSSSGLLEVPYFKKGTINIGNRQKGRLRAQSVIDCEPFTKDISEAINYLYTEEFLNKLKNIKHPYGNAGASLKIFNILKKIDLKNISQKSFFDL